MLNVSDFGAKGDGVADDTSPIQAAIDAAGAAGGGTVFFPRGDYLCSALTITAAVRFLGDGAQNVSKIIASATTGDLITGTGFGVSFSDLKFTCGANRTSGAYIKLDGVSRARIERLFLEKYFVGIDLEGVVDSSIRDCSIRDGTPGATAAGSCGIRLGETDKCVAVTIDANVMDAAGGSMPSYGILMKYADGCVITNNDIIRHGTSLCLAPGDGQFCGVPLIHSNYFDTATMGIQINPTGTGNVFRPSILGNAIASHSGNGISILNSGSGVVQAAQIIGNEIVACGGHGVLVNVTCQAKINGNLIAGCAGSGVVIAANVDVFDVSDNWIGSAGSLAGNLNGILFLAGTSTGWKIERNRLLGNTNNPISMGTVTGAVGRIVDNQDYNGAQTSAAISLGASVYAYTAGYAPEEIFIYGGVVSDVTVRGQTIAVATGVSVRLGPKESLIVTYSSAPTMKRVFH